MASPDLIPYEPEQGEDLLRVSRYDRVAGMLLTLLILVGSAVLVMLLIWLSRHVFASQTAVPVVMEEIGTGDDTLGGGPELETPSVEELAQEFFEPELKDTLSAITTAVTDKLSLLEDPLLEETARQSGHGTGKGTGIGSGTGSGSGRARRWEIQFPKENTLEEYARQLDFFKIELGVVVPGNRVEYAFHLSQPKPDRRMGPADQENRYYLSWRHGELARADQELLGRAGIEGKGKVVLRFLPPELEATLVGLERARAGDEQAKVYATRFAIRPDKNGYVFYVIDQTYK